MKPRDFLNFFKTPSGRLLLFAAIFGGCLVIFSVLRGRSEPQDVDVPRLVPSATQGTQTVQSFERPMQPFRLPATKTPPTDPIAPIARSNDSGHTGAARPQPEVALPPPTLAPISLLADTTSALAEPRHKGSVFAPFGRLIPCETVITVDSSSIHTPIVGFVTEDIYHAGRLVIPAGTEVHGTAQTDRHRERIASGNNWTLIWQAGEELRLNAIVLDREFSGDQEGWGITDGSAGLRGRLIKSDDLAEIKLFAATFLSGAAAALTEKEQTIFGSIESRSLNNAPFLGAEKVVAVYAQRIYDSIQRDGFYVRVASGKQFYLYVLQTIDRAQAVIGGAAEPFVPQTNGPSGGVGSGGLTSTPLGSLPSAMPSPPSFPSPKNP